MYINFKNIIEVILNLFGFIFENLFRILIILAVIYIIFLFCDSVFYISKGVYSYSKRNSSENKSSSETVKCTVTITGHGKVNFLNKETYNVNGLSSFEINDIECHSIFEMEWKSSNDEPIKIHLHFEGLTLDREFNSLSGSVSFQTAGGCFIHNIKSNLGG